MGALGFDVVTGEEEIFAVNPHFSVIDVAEKESHGAKAIIAIVVSLLTSTGSLVELLEEGFENK